MTTRRPIYRKQQKPSMSWRGLKFCVGLGAVILLIPIGGDLTHKAKVKVRDFALHAGLVDLSECVVTPDHTLTCTSGAVGVPLPAALRQMQDDAAQLAEEKKQRAKAEAMARQLAMDLDRLTAQASQNQVAQRTERLFPPFIGAVAPTAARTGASDPTGSNVLSTTTKAQSAADNQADPANADADSFSVTPPSEE